MEFVLLPIYDENGMDTGKKLKINTRYFLGSAGSVTAHRDIEVVKPDPVAEEIEMVDRIIAGLPPKPSYIGPFDLERNQPTGFWDYMSEIRMRPSAHFVLENGEVRQNVTPEEVAFLPESAREIVDKGRLESVSIDVDGFGEVTLVDVVSKYPKELFEGKFPPPEEPDDKLRIIPGFTKYTMNDRKQVFDENNRSVSIVRGSRFDNVFLWDDHDQGKRMSIDFLFKKTFPEYK